MSEGSSVQTGIDLKNLYFNVFNTTLMKNHYKIILATIFLLGFVATKSFAQVTLTWTNGNGTGIYSDPANWDDGSGGNTNGVPPQSGDDMIFDGTSNANCQFDLTVPSLGGTLGSAQIIGSYSGSLSFGAGFNFFTTTFTMTTSSGACTFTGNSGNISVLGAFLLSNGTYDGGSGANTFSSTFTQTGGTYTPSGSTATYKGDFTSSGGTFNPGTGVSIFSADGLTINNSPTFNDLTFLGAGTALHTCIIDQSITVNGVLTMSSTVAARQIILNKGSGAGTINCIGSLSLVSNGSSPTVGGGTATIMLNAGGSQSITGSSTDLRLPLPNLTIDEGAATATIDLTSNNRFITIGGTLTLAGTGNITLGTTATRQFTALGDVIITNTDNSINTSAGKIAFEGATSANFTSAVSWGQGSVGNILFAKTGGTITLGGIISVVGNLTDNNGAGATIDAVTNSSTVSFQGNALQTISGTSASATPFFDLDLSPQSPGGLTVSKAVNIFDDFSMDATAASVVLNTGNAITIKATSASQNGYIGEILNPGSVTFASSPNDQFTIERFIPATTTSWANMGSPGLTNITFQAWGGAGGAGGTGSTFTITCPTCTYSSVNGSAFNSVDIYSETAGGLVGDAARYVNAIANIATTSMANGTGYWVFRGNSGVGTGGPAITLSMNGSIQKEASPMPSIGLTVTNTGAGAATDHGWNLIANPYPCPISWALLWNGNGSVDNETHIYNPSVGADASWDGTTGVNGGSDAIPMGQGFAVHATSATSLALSESMKTGSQQSLFRVNTAPAPQVFRMAMDGGPSNWHDELALYFKAGVTTPGRSNMGGAMKFYSTDYYAPAISTVMSNGLNLSIYAAPPFSGSINIPVMAMIMKAGTYTIKTTDFGDVPAGACVVLYDNLTHTTHDLRSGGYTYTSDTTTVNPRFNLIISTPMGLTATTSSNEPTCSNNSNGNIIASGSAPGPWDYVWTNGSGATVRSVYAKASADTLSGLNTGTYTVNILRSGACDQTSQTFTITNPSAAVAAYAFTDNDTLTGPSVSVQMNNSSVNASSYYWNFGNGTNSTNSNPMAVYTATGNYTVTLDAFNVSCNDTVVLTKVVHILPPVVTGINNLAKNSSTTVIGQDPTGVFVQFNNGGISNSLISVYNELGQKVIEDIQVNAYKDKIYLDLSNAHNEMLLIHVQSGEKSTTSRVFNK